MQGRPPKINDKTLELLKKALTIAETDEEACRIVGISKHALYDYVKKNPDFKEEKMYLKRHVVRHAKNRMLKLVDSHDERIALQASKDILDRYEGKAKERIEHSGTIGISDEERIFEVIEAMRLMYEGNPDNPQ